VAKIVGGILPSLEAALDQIADATASSGVAGNR